MFLNLNIAIGSFLIGYSLVVYNSLQTQIQYLLYSQSSESEQTIYESLITAVLPLGGCLGSVQSSFVFKIFGRKNSFFLIDFVCILGVSLTLYQSLTCLLFGRFIFGICMGLNSSLVGVYIREISPLELGDYFCSLINVPLNFGIFIAFLFGLNTLSDDDLALGATNQWWRFMFGFPIFFCFLRSLLIFFKFNYESPLHLLNENKASEAMEVIKALYNAENAQEVYEELSNHAFKLKGIEMKDQESLKKNFIQKHLLNFLIAFSMIFANQFSGINALVYYSSKLFKKNGWSNSVSNLLNGGFGLMIVLAGLFMILPLKKFGIRFTYLFSLLLTSLCLGIISLCSYLNSGVGVTINIFLFDFFFSLGCGPLIFAVIPKILPDLLVGISFSFFWFFAFIIGLCFPYMIESSLGVDGSFLLFCICVFLVFIFNYFFMKEKTEGVKEENFEFIVKKF